MALLWVAGVGYADETVLHDPLPIFNRVHPQQAMWPSGDIVVVWADRSLSTLNIVARRFDSAGQALDPSTFYVNTATTGDQAYSDVATTADGGFVVVWESLTGSLDENGIKARTFDAQAQALGPEVAVQVSPGTARRPAISRAPDGTFVVAWSIREDSIRGRRLDVSGSPTGGEWVFDAGPDIFRGLSLSHNGDGEFLLAWSRLAGSLPARLFAADGSPLASELALDGPASVAFNGDRFFAAWPGSQVGGQLIDADGALIGSELLIDDVGFLIAPSPTGVAATPDGDFQVVWKHNDGENEGVKTGRFSSTGDPVGQARQVNSTVQGGQTEPSVEVDGTGRPVVIWRGIGEDGFGVYGCFDILQGDIFADGFEAGDTLAWSLTSP